MVIIRINDAAVRNITAVNAIISSVSFLLETLRISFSRVLICDKKTKNPIFFFQLLYIKSSLAQHSVTPVSLKATAMFNC